MANRKSIQENIQRVTGKITELNADLQSRKELSVLDIDLLRKHVIDLYDEVNHLRLVMKETIDHGPWTIAETKGLGDEETRENDDEEMRNDEEMGSEANNIEALSKAENQVEAEAEVEAMVEAIVEEEVRHTSTPLSMTDSENTETRNPEPETQNPEPETQNPLPAETLAKESEIKLAAAEAKAEADAIKAALNPEEANDLAYKFSNTPIHDLKKAISIAKKFEFINTLFGGNVEKYAYSIHHINNLNNGDEAFTYLHDLRTEWKWDDEDKNFQELANLIRRRFLG